MQVSKINLVQYNTPKYTYQNNISFKEDDHRIKLVSAEFAAITTSVFAVIVLLEEAMRGGGVLHQLLSCINSLNGSRGTLMKLSEILENLKAGGVAVPASLSLGISSLIRTITNAINRANNATQNRSK